MFIQVCMYVYIYIFTMQQELSNFRLSKGFMFWAPEWCFSSSACTSSMTLSWLSEVDSYWIYIYIYIYISLVDYRAPPARKDWVHTSVYIYIYLNIWVNMHIYINTYADLYIHLSKQICIYMQICIYIYIYISEYIYIYI